MTDQDSDATLVILYEALTQVAEDLEAHDRQANAPGVKTLAEVRDEIKGVLDEAMAGYEDALSRVSPRYG